MAKERREKIKKKVKEIREEIKKEVLFNVPNSITLLRLVLVFIFVYMIFSGYSKLSIIIVFTIAALTDWFDGFFARRLKQTTQIGARMDQVIDRVFTIVVFISLLLYFYFNGKNSMIILLFLSITREMIGAPGFIIALIRNKDTYHVKYIGKLATFVQGFAIGAIILEVSWAVYLVIPAGIIGIISGFDYLKNCLS